MPRGVCKQVLKPQAAWEGSPGKAAAANRTREIRPSGMRGGLAETLVMVEIRNPLHKPKGCMMETLHLKLSAPYFYPTACKSYEGGVMLPDVVLNTTPQEVTP